MTSKNIKEDILKDKNITTKHKNIVILQQIMKITGVQLVKWSKSLCLLINIEVPKNLWWLPWSFGRATALWWERQCRPFLSIRFASQNDSRSDVDVSSLLMFRSGANSVVNCYLPQTCFLFSAPRCDKSWI